MLPFLMPSDVPKLPAIIVPVKKEATKPVPYVIPPVEYTVVENDHLTKIAETHKTSVQRLWDKNTNLTSPDIIRAGDKLVIPTESETLPSRPLPVPPPPILITPNLGELNPGSTPAPNLTRPTSPAPRTSGGLIGRIGWATPYGNCVNTAKAHGKNQPGNPSSWRATTRTPFIGAAALFHYNHVGIVVGIHPNGDVEIGHENYQGGQTRFSPSELRGYF